MNPDLREKILNKNEAGKFPFYLKELSEKEKEEIAETGTIAAVKYSVLRVDAKADVMFDKKKSVSLEGNSGPYLLDALCA